MKESGSRQSRSDRALFFRLLRQARPYWPLILVIFLLDLLATPLALLAPVPLAVAVDSALGGEPLPGFLGRWFPTENLSNNTILVFAVMLLVVIALLSGLRTLASSLLRTYAGERLVLDLRSQLFRHAQRLSLSYHDSRGTADSVYRIVWDSAPVRYVAIDGVTPFITAAFTLVSMLFITWRIDWQLALVALAVSPFLFMIARAYRQPLRNQSRQLKKLESDALSVVQEVLGSLRVVKAFGQEDREQERFMDRSRNGMQARLRYALMEDGLSLVLGLITAVGTAAVIFIGVHHVQLGILTLGSLLLIMGYLSELYGPLSTISRKAASLQKHLASAERAYALLDHAPDVPERPNARPVVRARGAVSFQGVSFAYGRNWVLREVSFQVPPGTRVGIAGHTGAGKTTLISLLTRFYDPRTGKILLDGVDLRDYKLADLRNQFAIVLQEPVLFSTSIAENISYAHPGASKEEIALAAKAANAHDFIVALPDGYDTNVGERGMRLSGGERQRIALARAFLKDAPILIMDEPTSSVDVKTEAVIMEAMERLMHGRTTFIIAHRLTTLENCNLLIEIEDGQLAQMTVDAPAAVQHSLRVGTLEAAILEA